MSFFDDEEETSPRTSTRPPGGGGRPPRGPQQPRSPRPAGGGPDRHALMVRRRIAVGVAIVLLIIIVLVINGCLKSQAKQSLKDYNHSVNSLAAETASKVSTPLFAALTGAGAKSALEVQVQIDQLRIQMQNIASKAQGLSVPGSMTAAQRALLMAENLRVEGMTKIAALAPSLLGSQTTQQAEQLAGDMELFLASDVIYSQRVVPLIQEVLDKEGIHEGTSPSRFLPNIGWLDPSTVEKRVTGQSGSGTGEVTSGTHGSALAGVSVGTTTLEPEPTLNHIAGGGSPTFTVVVENTGSNEEHNVKVNITVTAQGKQYKAAHVINSTQPGAKANVEIPLSGIPTGVAAKIEADVEPVPGEEDTENNKATYLAIFSE